MSCIKIKDIAQYEETDSELAKYTIATGIVFAIDYRIDEED